MTQPEGPGLTLNLTDLSADTEPADYSPVGTDLVGTLAAWERPDPSLRAPPEDLQALPSLSLMFFRSIVAQGGRYPGNRSRSRIRGEHRWTPCSNRNARIRRSPLPSGNFDAPRLLYAEDGQGAASGCNRLQRRNRPGCRLRAWAASPSTRPLCVLPVGLVLLCAVAWCGVVCGAGADARRWCAASALCVACLWRVQSSDGGVRSGAARRGEAMQARAARGGSLLNSYVRGRAYSGQRASKRRESQSEDFVARRGRGALSCLDLRRVPCGARSGRAVQPARRRAPRVNEC